MQKPRLELSAELTLEEKITEQLFLIKYDLVTLLFNLNEIKHDIKDIKLKLG